MNKAVIPLILVNVLMTSIAQIALKAGANNPAVAASFKSGFSLAAIPVVLTTPMLLIGLTIYFVSALLWLVVLSKVDVSFAYPFVGLGFIMTMVFGWLLYGESLTTGRIVGTITIAAGVAILARS